MPAPARQYGHAGQRGVIEKTRSLPNDQEIAALAAAADTLAHLAPSTKGNAEALAHAVISKWIIERMKTAAGVRLHETCVFDLADSKLRGLIEAALPKIAEALDGVDLSRPLFDTAKDDIVSVFAAACIGVSHAAEAYGESHSFPFDDALPFGEAA